MAQGSGEVGEGLVQTAAADEVPSAPTSDEIRSQIEQTRADMSDTIDAIQSRLSPKRVLADARDSVTEATVGRVKRLTDMARRAMCCRGCSTTRCPSRWWQQPPRGCSCAR